MRISLTSWNTGFYECSKNNRGEIEEWIIPYNENRETDKIVKKILSHSSDIIVLNEFGEKSNRPSKPIDGTKIVKILKENGYKCVVTDNWYRSILIAIKEDSGLSFGERNNLSGINYSFEDKLFTSIDLPPECRNIKTIKLLGVGIPPLDERGEKRGRVEQFWNELILGHAKKYTYDENVATIIAGDYNAFLSDDIASQESSEFSHYLAELNNLLFDSWRLNHSNIYQNKIKNKFDAWTWYSSNEIGRRLDYIFVSKNIINTLNAEHFHEERTAGYSDHSAVHITFEV